MLKWFLGITKFDLLLVLLAVMIVVQFLTWRSIVSVDETIEHWGCGSSTYPCKVVPVPDDR